MKKFTALIAAAILALTVSMPVFAESSDNINETSVSSSVSDENSKEEDTNESSIDEQSEKENSADEQSSTESSVEEQSDKEHSVDEQSEKENSIDEQSGTESSADEQSDKESSVQETSKSVSYASYPIPEAGMYISFPKDMFVITRNIDSQSSILKAYKLTKNELLKNFEETDTYLKASADDFTYDITVNVLKNDDTKTISDLSSLEESDIQTIVGNILKQPVYTGCSRTKYNNIPYLSFPMEYDSEQTKVKGIQEYTIVRGARIVITFQSYTGDTDDNFNNIITEVMNSVVFDGINPNPEISKPQSSSVNNLDIRYIYLIMASVLAILFLMLIIVTAMKYKKSRKKALPNFTETKNENPPPPDEEKEKKKSISETVRKDISKEKDISESTDQDIPEEHSENIPEPVAESKEDSEPVPSPIEEKQQNIEENLLPVVENQLEIVEIALRIIPALKPELDDDTEIWNFIRKKMHDMEFFANHAPQNFSNANAFYRINANSNIQTLPKAPSTVDDAIRTETLQTVVGDSKPETLQFAPDTLSEKEEPDFNELISSAPENIPPVPQDISPDEESDISTLKSESSPQEKISAMNPSEMKLGTPPKRPKNEIYKADETVPANQTIQLEIAKSDDGKIKIGANNGTKSLDVEIKDVSKKSKK